MAATSYGHIDMANGDNCGDDDALVVAVNDAMAAKAHEFDLSLGCYGDLIGEIGLDLPEDYIEQIIEAGQAEYERACQ